MYIYVTYMLHFETIYCQNIMMSQNKDQIHVSPQEMNLT